MKSFPIWELIDVLYFAENLSKTKKKLTLIKREVIFLKNGCFHLKDSKIK